MSALRRLIFLATELPPALAPLAAGGIARGPHGDVVMHTNAQGAPQDQAGGVSGWIDLSHSLHDEEAAASEASK